MPKRRLAEDGFEAHKDAILKLYKEEHQPISVTNEAMARQGFRRSETQYRTALKKWGVTKNIKKEEWKYIVARLQEREAQGKRSSVTVRGFKVLESKIKKQRKLYEHDTYQRIASSLNPTQRPPTPGTTRVYTPPPSNESGGEEVSSTSGQSTNSPLSCTWPSHPEPVGDSFEASFLSFEPTSITGNFWDPRMRFPLGKFSPMVGASQQNDLGNLQRLSLMWEEAKERLAVNDPKHPEEQTSPPTLLSYRQSLKLINTVNEHFSSNSSSEHSLDNCIARICREEHIREGLRTLARRQVVSVKDALQSLLLPAVEGRNLGFIRFLSECDVNLGLGAHHEVYGPHTTALEISIAKGYHEITEYLLPYVGKSWDYEGQDWSSYSMPFYG